MLVFNFIKNEKFLLFLLFLLTFSVTTLRNLDPILNPILYTEDGQWLGMAFTKGWGYTFLYVKDGYFVWLNLILLFISEKISYFLCDNSLLYLSQSITFISYLYYSLISILAFYIFRNTINIKGRFFLLIALILLPFGDSSNEILGRISNIGYYVVFLTFIIIFYREKINFGLRLILIDILLFIFAGTNPVIIPIISIYFLMQLIKEYKNIKFWKKNIFLFLLMITIVFLILFIHSGSTGGVTGTLQWKNFIEVAFARSILYPMIFPIYSLLNDYLTILFLFLYLLIITYSYNISSIEKKYVYKLSALFFLVFWIFTIYMRQSLTQQLGDYNSTFPDRYFIGLNIFSVFIFIFSLANILEKLKSKLSKMIIYFIFILYASTLFKNMEIMKTRLYITNTTFMEDICQFNFNNKLETHIVPTNFDGWTISIPSYMIDKTIEDFCNKLTIENDFKVLNLNDMNWQHGVSKDGYIILLKNTKAIQNNILKYNAISFSECIVININKFEIDGKFIRIYLNNQISNINEECLNDIKFVDTRI